MNKRERRRIAAIADAFRDGRVVPRCPHFGECGGCLFQDIPYEDQLEIKRRIANDILDGLASVDGVLPSSPFRYRSRMDMVTAFGKCGLRKAGSYQRVVDVSECHIMRERSERMYRTIRPLLAGVDDYDYLRHQGYLRYVVFREAAFTGEVMVCFVTARRENLLSEIIEALSDAESVVLLHHPGAADLSFGEVYESIGKGFIEESLDGVRYRITPNAFFQSNAPVALRIYRRIRDLAAGRVLDLCAGVGGISLFIAGSVDYVIGVEVNPESVQAADENRILNRISNAEFECADTLCALKDARGIDTVVMDPPRSGMGRERMQALDRLGAERIIYLSCNPATFRQDADQLSRYRLEGVEAYDMFPQTPHVELLGLFTHT